jgi:hypothetical protein
MIAITFACGHQSQIAENVSIVPICPTCQERQITHTKARAPHFRGTCSGPYAETVAVPPGVVSVAPAGALPLKE